jgi:hypothetical protein
MKSFIKRVYLPIIIILILILSIVAIGATKYFDLVTNNLTIYGLTSGRVPIVSTGGLLADDADLTFTTDTLKPTKLNVGLSLNFSRFYSEITLDTGDAETDVGLTPSAVIVSAAIKVSVQVDGLDSADHHIKLGVSGTTAKYCDASEGGASTSISKNKGAKYTFDPSTDTEASALILTIDGGGDNTPSAGKCYVEVIYLQSANLPDY